MEEKEFVIGKYLEHNQQVRDDVPAERLLEFDPVQGWEPLCAFLDCPVPDEEYPRLNTSEDFRKLVGSVN